MTPHLGTLQCRLWEPSTAPRTETQIESHRRRFGSDLCRTGGIEGLNTVLWAVMVGEMRRRFERPGTLRLINRTGGGFLIGAGVLTALARRAA